MVNEAINEEEGSKIHPFINNPNYEKVMTYLEAKCGRIRDHVEGGVVVIDDLKKLHYDGLMARLGMGVMSEEEFDTIVKEVEHTENRPK